VHPTRCPLGGRVASPRPGPKQRGAVAARRAPCRDAYPFAAGRASDQRHAGPVRGPLVRATLMAQGAGSTTGQAPRFLSPGGVWACWNSSSTNDRLSALDRGSLPRQPAEINRRDSATSSNSPSLGRPVMSAHVPRADVSIPRADVAVCWNCDGGSRRRVSANLEGPALGSGSPPEPSFCTHTRLRTSLLSPCSAELYEQVICRGGARRWLFRARRTPRVRP
jgi:hypothetical protein